MSLWIIYKTMKIKAKSEELWDKYSEYIDPSVHCDPKIAWITVLTKSQYEKLVVELYNSAIDTLMSFAKNHKEESHESKS